MIPRADKNQVRSWGSGPWSLRPEFATVTIRLNSCCAVAAAALTGFELEHPAQVNLVCISVGARFRCSAHGGYRHVPQCGAIQVLSMRAGAPAPAMCSDRAHGRWRHREDSDHGEDSPESEERMGQEAVDRQRQARPGYQCQCIVCDARARGGESVGGCMSGQGAFIPAEKS